MKEREYTMEIEKGISYVIMPIEVMQSQELTPTEKMLYCYLTLFKKQCCFQSNASIAKAVGVDARTVTRGLKKLEDMEYVFIEYLGGDNSKRRIYVLLDNPKKLRYLMKKGALKERGDEKAPVEEPKPDVDTLAKRKPVREDFESDEEYVQAIYKWTSVRV